MATSVYNKPIQVTLRADTAEQLIEMLQDLVKYATEKELIQFYLPPDIMLQVEID